MSAPRCPCGAPTGSGGFLCSDCTGKLQTRLELVPDLLEELATTQARQGRADPGGKRTDVSPMPHLVAAEAAVTLRRLVGRSATALAAALAGEAADSGPGRAPAAWLARHVGAVRHRDWAPALAVDLKAASDQGWRVIDRPEELWYAGPCGGSIRQPDGFLECGWKLWARLDEPMIKCRNCHTTWDVLARRKWLSEAGRAHLESAGVIASAVTIMRRRRLPASTIRSWAHRGHLAAMGTYDGRTLYRVGDVLDLLEQSERDPDSLDDTTLIGAPA